MSKDKLVIVSTRLPITVKKIGHKIVLKKSDGGLASALGSITKNKAVTWVGWPGIASDELSSQDKQSIVKELKQLGCVPVFLSQAEIDLFYSGYSNATLWPLFHYFTEHVIYDDSYWTSYKSINHKFYKSLAAEKLLTAKLWVHDYQLMLLPKLIKDKESRSLVGFFLHIPFPSFEIFRLLPERREVLEGLLGADLIGFHTYDYLRHFASSVRRILGISEEMSSVMVGNRVVKMGVYPISIDYDRFRRSNKLIRVKKHLKNLEISTGKCRVIASIDRADYSKGILKRLEAYEMFLEQNPGQIGKVILMMLAVPSREDVEKYQELRVQIEQKVSRINGRFASSNWSPIHYRYQSISFEEVCALYLKADVMLVTPLRDGMNLVAKEYIATRQNSGVLILSEMAGAASEFRSALLVNPNNSIEVARAIHQALTMPKAEQSAKLRQMQDIIETYDVSTWAQDYLTSLSEVNDTVPSITPLATHQRSRLLSSYHKARRRLIMLDYDGTLHGFVSSPKAELAKPSKTVLGILNRLVKDGQNTIAIISGRPKKDLDKFFKIPGLVRIAEHGGYIDEGSGWQKLSDDDLSWRRDASRLIQSFVIKTPGSLLETKDFSLVWHYRSAQPDLTYLRMIELKSKLRNLLKDVKVGVFDGSKVVEVRPLSIQKGSAAQHLLYAHKPDFILAIGDDKTDEDMFAALPSSAWSVHVGHQQSVATYRLNEVASVIELLKSLA